MNFQEWLCRQPLTEGELVRIAISATGGGSTAIVFVAGSIVEGMDNAWSDVDLFVIDERPATGGREPVSHEVRGLHVDVELWNQTVVADLVSKVESLSAAGNMRRSRSLDRGQVEFAHRLATGVVLVGEAVASEWQLRLKAALPALLVLRAAVLADGFHLDALGAMTAGDYHSAAWMSDQVLNAAIDAFLAAMGSTSENPKWRIRRLREVRERSPNNAIAADGTVSLIHDEYVDIAFNRRNTAIALAQLVRRNIRLANRVFPWACAQLLQGSDAEPLLLQAPFETMCLDARDDALSWSVTARYVPSNGLIGLCDIATGKSLCVDVPTFLLIESLGGRRSPS